VGGRGEGRNPSTIKKNIQEVRGRKNKILSLEGSGGDSAKSFYTLDEKCWRFVIQIQEGHVKHLQTGARKGPESERKRSGCRTGNEGFLQRVPVPVKNKEY